MVELLLVSALIGLVLMTIFAAYASGVKLWRNIRNVELLEDKRVYLGMEKFRREMSEFIRDFEEIEMEGDQEKVVFPHVSGTGIFAVTYEFDKNKDGLVRKRVKHSESLKDKMDEDIALVFDADRVEFSYLFYDAEEGVGSWIESFTLSENGVPEAIKLKITKGEVESERYIFIPK